MNMRNKAAAFHKVICIVTMLVIALCLCGCEKSEQDKYPSATQKFFVNDFAGVLNEADAEKIYNQGVKLNEKTTAQAVVVTVESLEGEAASEYALQLGRQWGVGTEEEDNGIVILFAEQDREIYIAVGYGLEGALPDSKTGRIIDSYGIPYFTADDFSTGLREIYNSVVNEIYIEYNISPDESYTPIATLPQGSVSTEEVSASRVAISWLVLVVLVLLYTAIFGRRGGLFIFGSPRFFGGGFHHGGFGGSGGGFGGFSGGGGSFGGGGAGRKF